MDLGFRNLRGGELGPRHLVAVLVGAAVAVAVFVASYRLGARTRLPAAPSAGTGWFADHWPWLAGAAGLLLLGLVLRGTGGRDARRMMPLILHVVLVVLLGLATFSAAAASAWYGLGKPALPRESRLDTRAGVDLVKLGLTVAGGLGGVIALVVAYRRQRVTEQENARAEEEAHRARIRDERESTKFVTERFAAACTLLGHDAPAVRLAGVYAVAALADDWVDQRQACIDVLCSYLRMPYEPDHRATGFRQGEREVRLSITRVIRDHLRSSATTAWNEHAFDLSGAVFDCGDLGQIILTGRMDLSHARFVDGTVNLQDVALRGGHLDLTGAVVAGGWLDLRGARFFDVSLRAGVTLDLRGATVRGGGIDLRNSAFRGGQVDLRGITFAGGVVDLRAPDEWVRPPELNYDPVPDGLWLPEAPRRAAYAGANRADTPPR